MGHLLRDRFLVAWALLVAVTLISARIGGPDPARWIGSAAAVSVAVLLIAAAKVAVVIFVFMEVRQAPLLLRTACGLWLLVATGVLLAVYFGFAL